MSEGVSSHRTSDPEESTVRVFVAATAADLEEHRLAVRDAILGRGWMPVCMEDFGARPTLPVEVCLEEVRRCDALVVVVAHRYGWVPSDDQGGDGRRSITWLEVDEAREHSIPIFAFVVDPDYGWPHPAEEVRLRDAETDEQAIAIGRSVRALKEFRSTLADGLACGTFSTPETLAAQVSASLGRTPVQPKTRTTRPRDLDAEVARYLRTAESAYKHLALAGFETRVRVPIQLEDMYVPLDAMIDARAYDEGVFGSAAEAEAKLAGHAREHNQIPLTEAFRSAQTLGERRGLVLLGDPGSGKTTHLKRLLLWLVREGPASIGLPEGMVPVFLPLRNLRDLEAGLDAFLEEELANPHLLLDPGFGRRLLERGNLLLLLDGLDEIADPQDRAKVARWIEAAIDAHPTARFVVTCRYAGYADQAKLDARLLELHLRPLTGEQASDFIHNWYSIVETSLASDQEQARVVAKERASALVTRLSQPDFRARRVFELTRNPLLLTGICLVHRDRKTLPSRRADLYDECINVLLERWRTAKELGVSLEAKAARRVLQPVAYWLHEKEGRTKATAEELAPTIQDPLTRIGGKIDSAAKFLRTIRDESGLLTGWSGEQYGFLHLGFQEYLAARHLRDLAFDRPEMLAALARNFGSSWWREVTLLLLALDGPPIFDRLLRLVVERQEFLAHPDLVEECLDDALEVDLAPFLDLLRREPGRSQALWKRQFAALSIVERHAPDELAALVPRLAQHPHEAIAERFLAPRPAPETVTADRGGYELIPIPGGTFLMGSPEDEVGRSGDEGPQHRVELPAFYLGRAPVTNGEYARFLEANPGTNEPAEWGNRNFNRPQQPVVGISWDEAQAYCRWAGLVLPSEAQWEYACRAGTTTRYWSGDAERDLARVGWYAGNSKGRLHVCGEKPANPWGLADMHGNVFEWCQDAWHDYGNGPSDGRAWEERGASFRVYRGGSFDLVAQIARAASRSVDPPSLRWHDVGFRPARLTTN
ncbi:MAG: SUMF1/EgtB/PvdO family nonheme iron enzyme [Planctomycetota bacterium]